MCKYQYEYECQSKYMQRIPLLSLALLSTLAVSTTALAGPLFLNGQSQRQAPIATIFNAPADPSPQPMPAYRPVAAQNDNGGGGFLQFLFRGLPGNSRNDRSYQQQDSGPGMVDNGYGQPVMDPRFLKQVVNYDTYEAAGTIVINTRERMLYLVEGQGRALRYGIGVGRPGFTWSGTHHITSKREWPDWTPPDEMLKRRPDLPRHMVGGPDNPLGARAMYLGSTLYRIHGSNEPWTIGTQVSSGCIRMRNEDVIDLYERVKVGAKVVVI